MGVSISSCARSLAAVFLLIAISCFGSMWPHEFTKEFNGFSTYFSYSFYLAVCALVLVTSAVVLCVIDFVITLRAVKKINKGEQWATAEQILGEDEEMLNSDTANTATSSSV